MAPRVGRKSAYSWRACRRFAFRGCFIAGFALVFIYCAKLLVRVIGTEIDPEGNRLSSLAATTPSLATDAFGDGLGKTIGSSAPVAILQTGSEILSELPEVPPHLLAITAAALSTIKKDATSGSAIHEHVTPKLHGKSGLHKTSFGSTSSTSADSKGVAETETAIAARPNLMLMMLDDPTTATERSLSPLQLKQGQEQHFSRTPFLDELSRSSLMLTSWASPSSPGSGCAPSRAALLTGRYAARNSITRPLHAATK
jgi:hypothetical protein